MVLLTKEMRGYSARQVAEVLDLPVSTVRSFARAGLLEPERGPRNEYRFTFRDIVLLRATKELRAHGISPSRVKRALERLQEQLPQGRPLSTVNIAASGDRVVVRDEDMIWEPESGQVEFDFPVSEIARKVQPLAARAAEEAAQDGQEDPDEWYNLGIDLEAVAPAQAREAYERAIRLAPHHADAHANLGRLLHEEGRLREAERHYRQALAAEPDNATAAFNLGVVLEDQGRTDEAVEAYERALGSNPDYGPAHFNLSRLHEAAGRTEAALRHLADYKRILSTPSRPR